MRRLAAGIILGLVGATVLLVGGMALADSGGGGGIDACYHDRTGVVRVDVSGDGCGPGQTAISLGTSLTTRVVEADGMLTHPGFSGAAAECGVGEVVLGGGLEVESINPDIGVVTSAPVELADGRQAWQVSVHSAVSSGDPTTFRAFAVCAPGVANQSPGASSAAPPR